MSQHDLAMVLLGVFLIIGFVSIPFLHRGLKAKQRWWLIMGSYNRYHHYMTTGEVPGPNWETDPTDVEKIA